MSTIVLITGANTGIGYETVKALYASPEAYTIILGSRSLEKADAAIAQLASEGVESKSEIVPVQLDIEDDASIDRAFEEVKRRFGRVDALVNNAGASFDLIAMQNPTAKGIREAWDRTYSVNVTSTQVFTTAFMPLLLASSTPRLLFLTSGLASFGRFDGTMTNDFSDKPVPKGWPKPADGNAIAYISSKAALNMMMLDWVRVLGVDGVKVFAISPGFLATGIGGLGADRLKQLGAGDPSAGGSFIRDVVQGKRDADAGKIVREGGVQPW